jgi:hypothetical protein
MKPQCPKCGTALKDDYGMVTCPSCGTIVFVDMDGIAHIGTDAPSAGSEGAQEEVHEQGSTTDDLGSGFAPLADYVTPIMSPAPVGDESSAEVESVAESVDAGVESPAAESSMAEFNMAELNMDSLLGYSEPTGETPLPDLGPGDDPLGISQYANSEISSAKDGPFLFRILLSGIDTKEIREALREAMEDSRFGWDSVQLMSRISKGNLVIDRVSPVKASILVNRIKRLPLGIRWEQYAITQMDSF